MDFPEINQKRSPVKDANPISRHLFLWILPLFWKGYKKDLDLIDLYSPRQNDISSTLGDKLERAWNDQLELKKSGKIKKAKLARALWSVFGGLYSALFILYVITECILRVSQPLFVRYLVQSFSSESDFTERDQYLLAGGVILSTFLVTMCFHPSFHGNFIIAMRCRVACSSLIYRKSLRLSCSEATATSGKLVNILSNDVNRFDLNLLFFPYFIVAPVQLIIFTYFLWTEFQEYCLVGISIVVVMTVMQYWNGKYSTEYRRDIAKRTDERGRTMTEIITAIRVIKMYAWEKPFSSLIFRLRKLEMQIIRKRSFLRGIYLSTFSSASKLVTFLTFLFYVLAGNEITADKVFFTVAVYNAIIQNMMYFVPSAVSGLGEVRIALERIEEFLFLDEKSSTAKNGAGTRQSMSDVNPTNTEVILTNATASWTTKTNHLSNVNIHTKDKTLTVVVGPIGSGKTTLLHVLLGELKLTSGDSVTKGKLAYACQEPWIFAGNVRQNILFGKPYDAQKYAGVVAAAELLDDFHQLDHGDMTIVGDRGVSLSGGQKARVNLARCLYQDADIYLLDDPLSAVDAKVSRNLFEKCIRGFLRNKLVILVTHQLQYLPQADHVVVLAQGSIVAQGHFQELSQQGVDFVTLLTTENEEEETQKKKMSIAKVETSQMKVEENKKQIGNVEKRAKGSIGGGIYWTYFRTGNSYLGMFLLFFVCIFAQLSITATDYWMSLWTNTEEKLRVGSIADDDYLGENVYLSVYGGLVGLVLGFNLLRAIGWFSYSYLISVNMHNKMFASVVRAPTKFFDENPPGRVMNRFTKDLGQMDEMLPPIFFETSIIFLQMVGVLGIVIASNWVVAPPALVVLLILYLMRGFFIKTAQDIKRNEGMSKSPVFSHAVSSLQGLTTIRSSHTEAKLIEQFDGLQDFHTSSWFLFLCSTRWFGIWVELISILFLAVVTFSFLLVNSSDGGSVGLAITSAMNLTVWFQFAMRQSAEVANFMTSVERTLEYVDLSAEAQLESHSNKRPPKDWPKSGEIAFQNVSLTYNKKPVLKNLTFRINSGEKIAIVGRTGAGKSTIVQALFRMTEPEGNIFIDGIELNDIGLHDVRKNISIIPQEPVLFQGTVRYNIDPFDDFGDNELWKVLQEVGLKGAVPALDFKVSDGGGNFSVGQKQLFCLARSILRKNKIIILDEATANVDPQTDAFIQETIREKFSSCTIITIAHRLHSVMDCNRILVLDKGNIMEFDHPWMLLQKEDGLLCSMVNSTGKASSVHLRSLAENSYNRQRAG